ncbi:hypothetical protein KEM52_001458 [Ascosphaera acerosa]|nr:hypothetical protein KEM52_001458 [Ascosphaera acerosa]
MRHCLTADDGGYYTSRGAEQAGTAVFGRHGDFVTSPEISQVFGELLGVWTVAEWMAQGRPARGVRLVEIGPGKGTLMADMLRSMRNFRSFASSLEAVYLVEASPVLRDVQRRTLCGEDSAMQEIDIGYKSTSSHLGVPVVWVEHVKLIPGRQGEGEPTTPFIFAHEFFDALPIHAFQTVLAPTPSEQQAKTIMTPTGPAELKTPLSPAADASAPLQQPIQPQWRELVVSISPEPKGSAETVSQAGQTDNKDRSDDDDLNFHLAVSPSATPISLVLPETSERYKQLRATVGEGATIEVCPDGQTYVQEIARMIGGANPHPHAHASPAPRPAGAALIIDYGPADTVPVNSLRGIRKHRVVSPFATPGQTDLSADVDFTALAGAAIDASPGVEVYGPVEQGAFLNALGIRERAQQLLRRLERSGGGAGDDEKRRSIESGWKRLVETSGAGMGRIYKAMAIVPESGGKRRPIGFGGSL